MIIRNRKNERARKNLEKFKNAKFNYAKFVKDYYMEGGSAYITVKVKSIDDIVSPHSVEGYEWINKKFADYVEKIAYYIPAEEKIILEICGTEFSEDQKKVIEKVIKDYFGLKLGDKIIDLEINKRKSMVLLIIGLAGLVAIFVFSNFNTISSLMEIIIFIFWFFLWEYGDLALLDRSDILTEKVEAGQLATMKITFI